MPDDNQAKLPPGSPSIQITLPGEWGSQKQEKVEVDSNRSIPGERRAKWTEAIALPARVADIMLQALTIVSASAFLASVARFIPGRWELMPLAVMLVLALVCCCVVAWQRYPDLRLFLFYLGCLVLTGGLMGVML